MLGSRKLDSHCVMVSRALEYVQGQAQNPNISSHFMVSGLSVKAADNCGGDYGE
jgi:hypothetical protein